MEIEVKVNQRVPVEISIENILDEINEAAMTERWSFAASIINMIELGIEELTTEQKEIVRKFLNRKLEIFK